MFCPLYSEARLAGEKRRDFSTELDKSTQNAPTSTKSEPVQSRLQYVPKVFSSESKGHNKRAKISLFSPQKRPFFICVFISTCPFIIFRLSMKSSSTHTANLGCLCLDDADISSKNRHLDK